MENTKSEKDLLLNEKTTFVVMEDEIKKQNQGKPQYSLIRYKSLEPLVRSLEFGAKKYHRNSHLTINVSVEEYLDSTMRHMKDFIDAWNACDKEGLYDKESKVLHTGSAMANLMFIHRLLEEEHNLKPILIC